MRLNRVILFRRDAIELVLFDIEIDTVTKGL